MKRILLLLLTAALVLSLCACGDSTPATEAPATKGSVAATNSAAPETKPAATEQSETLNVTTTEAPTEEPTVEATEAPFVPQGKVEIVPETVPSKLTLKDLGPVAEGEGTLTFRSDDLLVRVEKDDDGNTIYLPVDHMGKQLTEERYGYFDELLPGLYLVSSLEDTVNNTGLMNEAGEMLIPCESAIISTITMENTDNESTQFLRVTYATEETTNEDEAFFYSTNAFFSLRPEEGDKLYKGYARIYDLVNKRFVPELTITNPNKYETRVGGGLLYLETLEGERMVCDAAGKELYKTTDYTSIELGDGFYLIDYNQVYDTQGNLLFQLDKYDSMQIIEGSARFLCQSDYDTKLLTVYDFYGNQIFQAEGPSIVSSEAGGLFSCTVDDKALLYDAKGELHLNMDNFYSPSYKGCGIWEVTPRDSEGNSIYYMSDDVRVVSNQRYAHNLVNEAQTEDNSGYAICPWNAPTEKVVIDGSTYANALTDGLISVNSKPASLVDCFSGKILMTADNFEFANSNYVYAKVDGEYHVYELGRE